MNEMLIVLKSRIQNLEDKLRRITRLDRWELWTWEEDEELSQLKAELEAFSI